MRNIKLVLYLILAFALQAQAQTDNLSKLSYDKKMQWWREAKLGMFVHWGPYSLYGGVYNGHKQHRGGVEWIMNRCKIPVREYKAKANTFNPIKFDAEKMVLTAKKAGMKYIVFTTKHHDGFAMFKSEASNFNIVDYTPFKRDVVDELAQACRKHDIKLGLYYSQSQDWCNEGGATARKLMWEGWANPDSTQINQYTAANNGSWDCLQRTVSFEEYFYKVSLPQIKELLTNYGDVAVLWWDTPANISDKQANDVLNELKKYPQIITNDRLKRPNFLGDYKTPEGRVPKLEDVVGVDWETCMNIGSSWGYKSYESNWKSSKDIIRTMATIAARGGNYLLNVGPDSFGQIPREALLRLDDMGEWLQKNGEAIYGTQRSLLQPSWGEVTRKDTKTNTILYLCVNDWPTDGRLVLKTDYKTKIATLLLTNTKLKMERTKGEIVIHIPTHAPDTITSVIKLELNQKLPEIKLKSNTEKAFEIVDEH